MMLLMFHPEALAEFEAGVRHYELQQPGLGERFIASIETALDNVISAPMRWPELTTGVYRHLARVFPYAVLYAVESDRVFILATMHCHRTPGYWRDRVKQPR
jgi:toxin ParE1/3/4